MIIEDPSGGGERLNLVVRSPSSKIKIDEGILLLRAMFDPADLLEDVESVIVAAPLRHFITPGGRSMSVAMTNCGTYGWVSDRHGYRYSKVDIASGASWPSMPDSFKLLARAAAACAGFAAFDPDSCLINHYRVGDRLGVHQDRDERDYAQPIVSVSLGLPAIFRFYQNRRTGVSQSLRLHHGDILVWGGPARLYFHGVTPIADGVHPLLGARRINLTLRRAA